MKNTFFEICQSAFPPVKKRIYRLINSRRNAIHLFLLCPPFSGSTVVKQLLATSPYLTAFRDEGQWLPEAKVILGVDNRWDPNLKIDWKRVRSIFNSYWSPFKPIRFEKSPPHVVRAEQLEREFDRCYFLISIRNPYAQIQGTLRRNALPSAKSAAEFWLTVARAQIYNFTHLNRSLLFTYEELTDETETVCKRILDFLPELGAISPDSKFTAHNFTGNPIWGLKNLNHPKIRQLSKSQICEINDVLARHERILNRFDYDLIQQKA